MKLDNHHYNILVVEDNPGDYLLVEDYLSEFIKLPKLTHATKFKEAVEILDNENNKFDVILLDLSLPDVSYEILIKEAEKNSHNTPVIILTGYSDLEFAIKSLSLGVSDYLVKDTISALILYKSIIYSIERHKFLQSLRESEKRYMDLFHSSPAPMWVYELDTLKFLDVNNAAIESYGYTKDEFLNMTIREIRPVEDIPLIEAHVKFLRENGCIQMRKTFRNTKKDGTIIYVEITNNFIHFNNYDACIVLATDITEKMLYIQAIEEQNKMFREIAWTQSHIVRAPLARILGIVDLIKKGTLKQEEYPEFLNYIFESADELDSIIKEIVNKAQTIISTENKST